MEEKEHKACTKCSKSGHEGYTAVDQKMRLDLLLGPQTNSVHLVLIDYKKKTLKQLCAQAAVAEHSCNVTPHLAHFHLNKLC